MTHTPTSSGVSAEADGPEEIEIDRLRLAAFQTNSNEDKAAYYLAVSKWFQDRHYRTPPPRPSSDTIGGGDAQFESFCEAYWNAGRTCLKWTHESDDQRDMVRMRMRAAFALASPPPGEPVQGVTEAMVVALRIGQSYVLDAMRNDGGIENCEIGYRTDFEKIQAALTAALAQPEAPASLAKALDATARHAAHRAFWESNVGNPMKVMIDNAIRAYLAALAPGSASLAEDHDTMQPDKYDGADFNGVVRPESAS